MSILKSILHRWNKDSKSYDTLHPETEVAQITDFADGIVSKLAATTAISAISALQTDSWFGKMMKWVLNASGVKYLIDTNGYVCFGSLFGGLIIQWGVGGLWDCYFPITFPNSVFVCLLTRYKATGCFSMVVTNVTTSVAHLTDYYTNDKAGDGESPMFLAIGR